MDPRTLVAQCGGYKDKQTGAIVPPVHASTTFARDESFQLPASLRYSRYENPTCLRAEEVLAKLDSAAAPAALLLDEPTASLDAGHRGHRGHRGLLLRLAAQGVAVLVVLHDLNEAAFVADRVAMLIDERLAVLGAVAEALEPGPLQDAYGLPFRSVPGGGLLPDFGAAAR